MQERFEVVLSVAVVVAVVEGEVASVVVVEEVVVVAFFRHIVLQTSCCDGVFCRMNRRLIHLASNHPIHPKK